MSAVATFAILPLLGSMWAFVLLYWLATIGGVCGGPGASVIVTKNIKPELSTIGLNMMYMFVMLAAIIGGFLAGPLMEWIKVSGMIIVLGILELIGVVMLFVGIREK